MKIKSEQDKALLRECGKKLAHVMTHALSFIRPGISAHELDRIAEEAIQKAGGRAVFKGYPGEDVSPFPSSICVSINDEIVHGIPSQEKIIEDGDIVSVDIGMEYGGMITDMARTVIAGTGDEKAKKLVESAKKALDAGIQAVRGGGHVGDIGAAIEKLVLPQGYGIIRELVGHGVGYSLHGEPQIPNYGKAGTGEELVPDMALAIEPMITERGEDIESDSEDGWTIRTKDGSRAAHFEDTVLVTKNGFEIITRSH